MRRTATDSTDGLKRPVAAVSVIILAYSVDRFPMDCAAVESVLNQTVCPGALMLCVDDNADRAELVNRFSERWPQTPDASHRVRIVESESDAKLSAPDAGQAQRWDFRAHYGFRGTGISAGRATALGLATTELVAFLDDDAVAEPDWLERLLAPFSDADVVAVGGAPLPVYAKPCPRWFPHEFNWVFGCAYTGLPTRAEPVLRVIGANMAIRAQPLREIADSGSMEDMEICHRLLALSPQNRLIYEPRAVVWHRVHENRLTWSYFWRRCYWANRDKVAIMRGLGEAANLKADRRFVSRAFPAALAQNARDLARGDIGGLERILATIAGVGVSAFAYAVGLVEWNLKRLRARN